MLRSSGAAKEKLHIEKDNRREGLWDIFIS